MCRHSKSYFPTEVMDRYRAPNVIYLSSEGGKQSFECVLSGWSRVASPASAEGGRGVPLR